MEIFLNFIFNPENRSILPLFSAYDKCLKRSKEVKVGTFRSRSVEPHQSHPSSMRFHGVPEEAVILLCNFSVTYIVYSNSLVAGC